MNSGQSFNRRMNIITQAPYRLRCSVNPGNKYQNRVSPFGKRGLGDYLNLTDKHPICTMEYYEEALNQIPDNAFLFIISDDNEKAADMFKDLKRPFCIPDTKNQNIDMCLMTMCDYHIIANSSFSWWGAWLANSNKVISPSTWFGPGNQHLETQDLIPENWTII